jgi:dCTP deaminase
MRHAAMPEGRPAMTDSPDAPTSSMGVLPDHAIRALIASGGIATEHPHDSDQVQPASLDLRLGTMAYRVRASFLTGRGKTLTERLPEFEMHRMRPDRWRGAGKGLRLRGAADGTAGLPDDISAVANAKSSTGRLDLPDARHHR